MIKPEKRKKFHLFVGLINKAQIDKDAGSPASMKEAVDRDVGEMQKHLDGPPKHDCADAYREAATQVKAHDNEAMMKKAIMECTS